MGLQQHMSTKDTTITCVGTKEVKTMLYVIISLIRVKGKTPAAPRTESAAPQTQSVYKQVSLSL